MRLRGARGIRYERRSLIFGVKMAAFQTSSDGNIKILAVSGRLDPQSRKDLRDTIQSLIEGGHSGDVLVDLERLDYMASAGFRELFLAGRQVSRQGGRLAVCSLRGEVKRVFELARFDTAYPVFETRHEALAYFRTQDSAS
jgi:anti-anti-sigma factor